MRWLLLSALLLFSIVSDATAQFGPVRGGPALSDARKRPTTTTVSVELLTGKEGVGLNAQEWYQVFEKLGVSLRVRRSILDEKPEVRERVYGTIRDIRVIGRLERDGRIVVPDHVFRRSEAAKLAEWIRELQTYGAQGSPEGKPMWGLDKSQFGSVYRALSRKLDTEVEGQKLEDALANMQLPAENPVRLTTTTRQWLRTEFPQSPVVRQSLKGMSLGTALAIALNDYGLGFRPLRTPEQSIELTVDPLTKTTDVWPVGWEVTQALERRKLFPEMFKLVPVELEDTNFADVLHAISVKTGVPILIDRYRIAARQIDVDSLRVSHKRSQTAWSVLIKRLANSAMLTCEFKKDEAGRPFVWITTLEPRRRER